MQTIHADEGPSPARPAAVRYLRTIIRLPLYFLAVPVSMLAFALLAAAVAAIVLSAGVVVSFFLLSRAMRGRSVFPERHKLKRVIKQLYEDVTTEPKRGA
jgi:membrane protein implicated in regulation of membrane protease activity